LSLEQLGNVEVTTVSKEPEQIWKTPAAIFVLTQEDIRRLGATSIPEALRLVPGVDVSQVDSNHWSIAIRGFAGQFSKSLLVLIDGRSVYTPLFSGVYWDVQNLLLEDVERIEVIRGPGGTIWGANAVNGVINIITKSAPKSWPTSIRSWKLFPTPYRTTCGHRFAALMDSVRHCWKIAPTGSIPPGRITFSAYAMRRNACPC